MSTVDRVSSNIQINGVKETVEALRAFEPELRKRLNKEIRAALNLVKHGAESRYPKGAWRIKISTKNILGSITTQAGTREKVWGNSSAGVRAAIFEFAGSVQEGRTPQAKAMIASLNARYGGTGRFLWDAWDDNARAVLTDIKLSVEAAERDLQASLDAAGESY